MRAYIVDKFGKECEVYSDNRNKGFEVDQYTGQRIWASDNGFDRYRKPRNEQFRTEREDRLPRCMEVSNEQKILNIAWDLKSKGKVPNPDMTLEEWVESEMGDEQA